eukprot:GHRQ01014851.1.p1 GENE.GHRQ01014851.1~~GHRQ01014851.1.p1  ORF type:complete len:153 (-),score=15.28 GHRQ01014851.1:377-835(-)
MSYAGSGYSCISYFSCSCSTLSFLLFCPVHAAEWYFRSGLDRYVWIWGMVCAYIHPHCVKLLNALEELPALRQLTVRALVLSVTALLGWVYYVHIYSLPKLEYNKVSRCLSRLAEHSDKEVICSLVLLCHYRWCVAAVLSVSPVTSREPRSA